MYNILVYLKSNIILNKWFKYLKSLNHPTADQAIKHLNMHTYNPEEVIKYKRYNGWLDRTRGTSIYDLDPIFEELLK